MSFWNIYAKVYDVINKNIPYLKMLSDTELDLDIQERNKILDAGCGTGNFSDRIRKSHPNIEIVAIDSSAAMLIQASKKLSGSGIEIKRINLEEKLDLADKYFDRIVTINALYTIKNQADCLREFHRILKDGGRLVISNPDDKYRLGAIFIAQLKELGWLKFITKFLLNLPALSIVILVNIFFIKKSRLNFLTEKKLVKMLMETGFQILKSRRTYTNQNLLITATKTCQCNP